MLSFFRNFYIIGTNRHLCCEGRKLPILDCQDIQHCICFITYYCCYILTFYCYISFLYFLHAKKFGLLFFKKFLIMPIFQSQVIICSISQSYVMWAALLWFIGGPPVTITHSVIVQSYVILNEEAYDWTLKLTTIAAIL